MRGLLIKDLKLLLGQKRFYSLVLGLGILFMITYENPSMGVGYITMLLTIFTLNTISYDEFDNGMSFLLTLPIHRKTYVKEKYVFSGLIAVFAAVSSSVLAILFGTITNKTFDVGEVVATGATMVVMSLLILAVTLPLLIKFGAEKGRMAMFAAFGMVGLAVFVMVKLFSGTDVSGIMAFVLALDMKLMVLMGVFVLIMVIFASYFICVRIISKKEY